MRRRGFLKLLGLLPFAPALAEVAAKTINKPVFTGFDLASGEDQTSIWVASYADDLGVSPSLLDVANKHTYNCLPVIEVLNQKNPFLQDVVWRNSTTYTASDLVKWGKS